MKVDLKGLDVHETVEWAQGLGLEPYRGRQIRSWLFKRLSVYTRCLVTFVIATN